MNKKNKLLMLGTISALFAVPLVITACNSQPAPIKPKPFVSVDKSKWQFHDEQEWIVGSIGRDIAEMLAYAKFHDDPKIKLTGDFLEFKTTCVDKAANKYRYHLVLPNEKAPLDYDFTLREYVWNPAGYADFAKKLMSTLDLKPSSSSTTIPSDFMKSLAQTDMASIWKENSRLSKALSASPLDSSLHQQSALLQATINMVELAGQHSDTRFPLNRMCAHMAIAKALNGDADYNIAGKIADIALISMSCRDALSVIENDKVAKTEKDPVIKSWLRALKIRSTCDFRIFDEVNCTPLEASQYGSRYSNLSGSEKAIEFMERHPDKCVPAIRWSRIIQIGGPSVGAGHQNTTGLFNAELNELLEDYNLCHDKKAATAPELIPELNKNVTLCLVEENGKPMLQPLSWDDMAAFHARHIAAASDDTYNFLEHRWAVHDRARQMIDMTNRLLQNTDLLPFSMSRVMLSDENKDLNAVYFSSMSSLMQRHPEKVTAYDWLLSETSGIHAKQAVELPKAEDWFNPALPMGSPFYFMHRKELANCKPTLAELTKMRELCPMDITICASYAEAKYGKKPNSDQLKEAYGYLYDFSLPVMQIVADGDYDVPAKYIPQVENIAKKDPSCYFGLASYCVVRGEDAQAAKYFQLLLDKNGDSVQNSNSMDWLVDYLYSHGKKEQALKIATDAADVYSSRGLGCLARLYERMGEISKAEKLYLSKFERYGESENNELTAFYARNAAKQKDYAIKAAERLKPIFPSGLQKFDFAQLKDPPRVGVYIELAMDYPKSQGLMPGCVIVGLNGYKTDSANQYYIVQRLPLNPIITATYWNGKEYKQAVIRTVTENKLNVGIYDYPRPAGTVSSH